jgi:hypothetical protein
VTNNRHAVDADAIFAATLFVAVALFFGIWLTWDATFHRLVTYSLWADYWEHTAALTEWMRNFSAPANPHVLDDSLSPRYMPQFWVLAFMGLFFGLTSIDLMSISAVVNYILITVGLFLFTRAYFRDPWAPLISFIAVYMFWGVSWNWSNLYQFKSFFYVAGYPSSFVFGLSLISFWTVLKTLRGDYSAVIASFLLFVLAALMFLCHPLTAVFGIVGCVLLVFTESSVSGGRRLAILLALGAGLIATELWPYFSAWKVALGLYGAGQEQWFSSGGGSGVLSRFASGDWQHIFYDPRLVITILGPALLGIPACVWLAVRKEGRFIVTGAVVMSIPYFINIFVELPLAHRFLLFTVFYLQLAMVWVILQVIDAWRTIPRPPQAQAYMMGTLAFLALIVVSNVVLLATEFRGYTFSPKHLTMIDKRAQIPDRLSVVELYSKLTGPLAESSVVLSTAQVGWPLPTVKGKVVALYHENPMVADQNQRYRDTMEFFYRQLEDQQRTDIIRGYQATHLLVSDSDTAVAPEVSAALATWLSEHAIPVAKVGSYRMYDIVEDSLGPASEPVVESTAADIQANSTERDAVVRSSRSIVKTVVSDSELIVADEPANVARPAPEPATQQPAPQVVREPARVAEPTVGESVQGQAEEQPATTFGVPIAEPLLDRDQNGS